MIEPRVFEFLRDLADNNSKDWMDDNRDRFDDIKAHLHEVGDTLIAELSRIDDRIAAADLSGADALMPLPHDTRFHDHDDTYKTGFTFSFCAADGEKANHKDRAAYWLHIEPADSGAGGGTVMTTNTSLNAIRDGIAEDWETFRDLMNRDEMEMFPNGMTTKDRLKTSPQGIDADHPGIVYLNMKDFRLHHSLTNKVLQSDDAKGEITKVFKAVQPIVTFMNDAIDDAG